MKKFSKLDLASNHLLIQIIRPNPIENTLSYFTPVSEDDVLKILWSSKTKTCNLYPISTSLVKERADVLKSPITNIINYTLKEGSFPNCFKTA